MRMHTGVRVMLGTLLVFAITGLRLCMLRLLAEARGSHQPEPSRLGLSCSDPHSQGPTTARVYLQAD